MLNGRPGGGLFYVRVLCPRDGVTVWGGWISYMLAIRSVIRIGIRMRLAVALILLVPGLVLAAGVGVA